MVDGKVIHIRLDEGTTNYSTVLAPVFQLCCTLVLWLSLSEGISRSTANFMLKALHHIFSTAITLIHTTLRASGIHVSDSTNEITIPFDIRTLYSQDKLEPEITRTACCPKCYKQYPGQFVPSKCTYRRSAHGNSKRCETDLWRDIRTRHGPKRVLKSQYTTQTFDSWLRFMLSRESIEQSLAETFLRTQANTPHEPMRDVQDSPAWNTFRDFFKSSYHLVFALYIDWFNPLTNKLAGAYREYFKLSISYYHDSGKVVDHSLSVESANPPPLSTGQLFHCWHDSRTTFSLRLYNPSHS
jgi:hypothetical protein